MAEHNTHQTPTPTCPHCGYAMTHEDMLDAPGHDLFELAINGYEATINCPGCGQQCVVEGGYRPHYTSRLTDEQLLECEKQMHLLDGEG